MNTDRTFAGRTVTGVVAAMVAAVTAATAIGFWLSYSGLHAFAVHAGMSGPEGWAWPASIDLFILAGEAGVTISALRGRKDWAAASYFVGGFAASVAGNVLHPDLSHLAWTPYAVAATPPIAAMLALAALLRHVYLLALDAHLLRAGEPVRDVSETYISGASQVRTKAPSPRAPELLPGAHLNGDGSHQVRAPEPVAELASAAPAPRARRSPRAQSAPVRRPPAEHYAPVLERGKLPSENQVMKDYRVARDKAKAIRAELAETRPRLVAGDG